MKHLIGMLIRRPLSMASEQIRSTCPCQLRYLPVSSCLCECAGIRNLATDRPFHQFCSTCQSPRLNWWLKIPISMWPSSSTGREKCELGSTTLPVITVRLAPALQAQISPTVITRATAGGRDDRQTTIRTKTRKP